MERENWVDFRVWFVFVCVRLDQWYWWRNWVAFLTALASSDATFWREDNGSTVTSPVPLSAELFPARTDRSPIVVPSFIPAAYHSERSTVKHRRCMVPDGASIIEQRSGQVSPREADAMPECDGMHPPNRRWRWPQGGDRPFQQSLRHRSLPVTASRFAESSSCFGYDGYESFNVRLFLHSVGQSLLDRTSCLGKSYIFRVFKEYWRWIWTKDFNPSFELFHMDGPILVTFMGTVQSWQSPMWAQRLCQMDVWHAECGRKRLTTGKWFGYTLFHCLIIMFPFCIMAIYTYPVKFTAPQGLILSYFSQSI
jgi:hypothetical protein